MSSVNPASISSNIDVSDREDTPEPGPSRKRQRTAASSEERKEARAHRNRIAAQNSRDRRKAAFAYLERRVSELEEENRQLRAGLLVQPPAPTKPEQEQAKDRENEELRERIKTLEKGWTDVMKALAAQGLSTNHTDPAPPSAPQSAAPSADLAPKQQTQPQQQQQPSEQTLSPSFPALEPVMTFPISPAPSHTSLDFELDLDLSSSSSSFLSTPIVSSPKTEELDSTRHLAAGGLDLSFAFPGDDTSSIPPPEEAAIDDATMEDLFREILAPSPRLTAAGLPFDVPSGASFQDATTDASPAAPFAPQVTADNILGLEELVGSDAGEVEAAPRIWTGELEVDMLEMDRILELLPAADAAFQQNIGELGLGLGWGDGENIAGEVAGNESTLVGVF